METYMQVTSEIIKNMEEAHLLHWHLTLCKLACGLIIRCMAQSLIQMEPLFVVSSLMECLWRF